MKKIAFITSGGDAPGMNSAIRSIVKYCLFNDVQPVGFYDGFKGLIDNNYKLFGYKDVNNIIFTGGTILGTSRSKEFETSADRKVAFNNLEALDVEGLIVIGGDGSFKGGAIFSNEFNLPVIGIPATIDNDIFGTDYTIGFDTALNTVVESIDKLRDTANSHHRMFFVEVMGRHSGFIALHAAMASGAEMVLIPEKQMDFKQLAQDLATMNRGERGSIFVVAEGDELGGVDTLVKRLTPYMDNFDVRTTVLGHIQRGGRPTASDRILGVRLGAAAVECFLQGKSKLMVGMQNNQVIEVKIEDAISKKHGISMDDVEILKKLLTLSY